MSQQRRSGHSRRNPSVDIPKYTPNTVMDANAQAAHERQRALAQISDYDSAYNSDAPLHPSQPRRSQEEMNLTVIQRHYPDVAKIIATIPYASIYEFETEADPPKWEKKEYEGSMFLCQLTAGPFHGEERYSAILLNRKSLQNFAVPLLEEESGGVELADPYIIVTFVEDGQYKVYGVYIFSGGEGSSTENAHTYYGNLMVALAATAGVSKRKVEMEAQPEEAEPDPVPVTQESQLAPNIEPGQHQRQQDGLLALFNGQHASAYDGRGNAMGMLSGAPPPTFSPPAHPQQATDLMALFRGAEPRPNSFGMQPAQAPSQQRMNPQHPGQFPQQQPNNVLGDLFRRSGFLPQSS